MIVVTSKVSTPDGLGLVKDIEIIGNFKRYGVLHNTFPANKPRMYKDDILYYFDHEVSQPA